MLKLPKNWDSATDKRTILLETWCGRMLDGQLWKGALKNPNDSKNSCDSEKVYDSSYVRVINFELGVSIATCGVQFSESMIIILPVIK